MVESSSSNTGASSQGYGSIWNKNSWHWEERNYTELAKKILSDNFIKIAFETENPRVKIRLYEVKELNGSASITIRKQKQIFLYEFKLEIYFEAEDMEGKEEKRMGRVRVEEFNQDDDDIDVNVVCEKPGDFTAVVKKFLVTQAKQEILRVVNELKNELKQIDANEEKIRRDQMEREQAAKEFEEAKQKSGDVKSQIFEEQKKKEAELKEQAKKILEQQQQQQPQKVEKIEGQGSVWNTNGYFWEEKSVAKWAEDRIKEVLSLFKHTFAGGELKIATVDKLKGESSISIRKGKKIVSYDYNCMLKWECSFKDGEGNEVASMKGTYELPEVSSDIDDEGDEWEIKAIIKEDPQNLKSRYENIIRKDAANALRKAIKEQFVKELKSK